MIQKLRFVILEFVAIFLHFLPSKTKKKFDLSIVRVDALGDYVLWLDALEAYKAKYSGKRVLLVCADINQPLAEVEPFFTEVISFNRKRMERDATYFLAKIMELRKISSSQVIYPVWQRHRIGEIFTMTITSKDKIGMQCSDEQGLMSRFYDRLYTRIISKPKSKSELLSIEHFTKQLLSPQYNYGMKKLLIGNINYAIPDHEYFVISFSASSSYRIWPVENFISVINVIPDKYKVVILGVGADDGIRAQKICDSVLNKEQLINYVNKTSVLEMIYIISKAFFVIGNDSAAVHIAFATRVQSICILSGAHYERFLPYPENISNHNFAPHCIYNKMECFGCNYNCKYPINKCYRCLSMVTSKMVIDEMKAMLN